MLIAIDAGNTRIKWGIHDGLSWVQQAAVSTAEAMQLAALSLDWPEEADVVACNVAGVTVEAVIESVVRRRGNALRWLRASTQACGVRNTYDCPEKLGADRWAALIGARARFSGACLVVGAGTATTADWLDGQGFFRGGLILPGYDLMRRSLEHNTARLPFAEGVFCRAPRNTPDAIATGCLHAQTGAIERMYATLEDSSALCVLTGGHAETLETHLNIPLRRVDNLVLEGLLCFAKSVS